MQREKEMIRQHKPLGYGVFNPMTWGMIRQLEQIILYDQYRYAVTNTIFHEILAMRLEGPKQIHLVIFMKETLKTC